MQRKLLVSGGAGFIGSNFVYYWLAQHPEDQIINLDALTYAGNQATLEPLANSKQHTFVHGNIADRELVDELMQGVTHVVHFAAESHVDRSILNPDIFLQTNVMGTHVLLAAAVKHKVQRFHHISTDEVFGSLELNSSTQFSEQTPYDPRSPYSASKAASDHLVRAYGETYDLPYSITNCSNNYGEYQFPEKLIPLAITNLMDDKSVPVYGNGLQVRDWLYVQDHCSAIEKVLLSEHAQNDTYLVGGLTEDIPNIEVIKQIISLMKKPSDMLEFVKDRAGHDQRYSVDWSRINGDLTWKPSVSFTEGLEKTIAWYQTHQEWWRPLKDNAQEFFATNYQKASE